MLQITLFHNFSKSVSEGNCSSLLTPVIQKLSQTASPYASIPVFIFSLQKPGLPLKEQVWTYRRDFRERAYWLDVSFVSSQLTLFSLPLSSWQIFGFYLITIDFTQVISDSVTTDGGRSQDNTGGDRTILLHAVIELIDFHWLLVILLVITSQTSNTLSLPICPKINISFLYDQKTWLVCNHLWQFYQLAVHLSLR